MLGINQSSFIQLPHKGRVSPASTTLILTRFTTKEVQKSTMLENSGGEVVQLAKETFNQSPADIKKAAKELVFKKFTTLLRNLA